MSRRGVTVALAAAVAAAPTLAHANACSIQTMASAYNAGHASYEAQRFEDARRQWEPLAALGFSPAQARIADMHVSGQGGLARDAKEGLRWAVLAAAGHDARGAATVARLRQSLGDDAMTEALAAARAWKAAQGGCRDVLDAAPAWVDAQTLRIGIGVVRVHSSFNEAVRQQVRERFPKVIGAALNRFPPARLYFQEIAAYDVVPGDLYDRYLGWKTERTGKELQLTIGSLLDDTPEFAAHALMLEAAREVYRQMPAAQLYDPFLRRHKGKRLVGSSYPDIDNQAFFDLVTKALDMAEQLPAETRRHVEIIDEVRYNPQSKRMTQTGPADSMLGYYDRRVSREGHRVIFIRRDMKWSFLGDVLLTLVHEGTHASQDQRALRLEEALPRKKGELEALERAGQGGSSQAAALRKDLQEATEYLTLWHRRGPNTEQEQQKRIRFECEATMQEIATGQSVGLEPRAVEQTPYFKLCDDAKRAMVRWKDDRMREGLKKSKQQ